MTFKEAIFIEVDSLPESKQADVLLFIRFVKIGLADPEDARQAFWRCTRPRSRHCHRAQDYRARY